MLVVTGATGKLGSLVVQQLLAHLPADRIAATARDPGKAGGLAERGVEVRRGNFADPSSLSAAFAGASKVLMISAAATGEEVLRLHRAAIEGVRDAGASRVLYTSHMGAKAGSLFPPMPGHAATERMLEDSGLACTALRHGFYAASALQLIEHGLASGTIALPEDGPVSWTTHEDLAEADAVALTRDEAPDGITAPLTAPEAFDMADLARIASEASGREIKRVVVTDQVYREALVQHGLPPERADLLLGIFQASRRGDFAATDSALELMLGRRPRTMREVLTDQLQTVSSGGEAVAA